MRSVILNTYDKSGGAARAAFRLHKGLQGIGVDSRMLVQFKSGDDPSVIGPASKWARGFSLLRPTLDSLQLYLYRRRGPFIFSPAILPDSLPAKVAGLDPDLIHLHWVAGGFLRLETLRRFNRPLMWTLHDSWAFTGGCHLPFDCKRYRQSCGRCPELGSTKDRDLSRKVWERKKKAWQGLNLTVVTPSRWLAECARSSSLFRNFRVEVIPNGLNVERFKLMDKRIVRNFLSLPQDKKLVLFGAMNSTDDRNKGFRLLVQALRKVGQNGWSDEAELMVFGSSEPANPPHFGLKAHYMGRLHDDISLAMLYAAADVFVLPSIQENLPNTIMEALACGTPIVSFDVGGIPEMVEHQKNGYLAMAFDADELARGIGWVLEDPDRSIGLGKAAREKAVKEYALEVQSKRYLALYEEILKGD
jgi:glycosyltransferase involved in cell wall biosynthesis